MVARCSRLDLNKADLGWDLQQDPDGGSQALA